MHNGQTGNNRGISSLCPESYARLQKKTDGAEHAVDIPHCSYNLVEMLSLLLSRHSKVTPAQLDSTSKGASIGTTDNRVHFLHASSRRYKPCRVLNTRQRNPCPYITAFSLFATCDYFRHSARKKKKTAITKMYFCARRAHTHNRHPQ